MGRVSKTESRAAIKRHLRVIDEDPAVVDYPKTRGECGTQRPCLALACRMNLFLDQTENGTISYTLKLPNVEDAIGKIPESCALDVADQGSHTLDDVGAIVHLTRERVRQIEVTALTKIKEALGPNGLEVWLEMQRRM